MRQDESVISVKNECEGVVMSAHGAGSGCEWVWWRSGSIRCRRSNTKNGLGGGDGGGGGDLTSLL